MDAKIRERQRESESTIQKLQDQLDQRTAGSWIFYRCPSADLTMVLLETAEMDVKIKNGRGESESTIQNLQDQLDQRTTGSWIFYRCPGTNLTTVLLEAADARAATEKHVQGKSMLCMAIILLTLVDTSLVALEEAEEKYQKSECIYISTRLSQY